MPLDPEIADLLEFIRSTGHPPMNEGSVEDARSGFAALARTCVPESGPIRVGSVVEDTVAGLGVRVYRPDTPDDVPTVIFFHGGGWVVGDLDTHDNVCRRLCVDAGVVVVAVDYRLAPEHPFPAAVDDAVRVTQEITASLAEYGGSPAWGVAGDSAGGNLAAIVAQTVPGAAAQLLIYPSVDPFGDYASRRENGDGYLIDLPAMIWFVSQYFDSRVEPTDQRLAPLHGVCPGLPAAVVGTAEFDPLRDEGLAYAAALAAAGVPVRALNFDGLVHGFVDLGAVSEAADAAIGELNHSFAALLR